jgi:outer membrane biosynthesis protein TonB
VLGAIAGAAVSFGVCFAVVADATRSSAPERTAERPKSDPSAIRLGLGPAAALRVREGLFPPAVASAASRTPPKPPAPTPTPTTTAPELATPQTQTQPTPVQTQPTQPTPKPAPKPKARPKPAPKPQGPDFDDTGPQSPAGGSG